MPFALNMPKLSPTMTEGTIAKWHKKEGDFCDIDELILDIGTDKATIEHHAIDPGILRKILIKEGEKASVGDPLAIFSEKADEDISGFSPTAQVEKAEAPKIEQPKKPEAKKEAVPVSSRISASPLAKKLAKERGISLETVTGSGPKGRIMSRDLETAAAPVAAAPVGGQETPLSPVRKVIAEKLSYAKATIPHFYCSIKLDATQLFAGKEELKAIGHTITINDIIIRAVALSLMKHPSIRGSFNDKRNSVVSFEHADIAVAISTPGGLFTPIIFKAEEKSIHEISKEMKDLGAKTKAGKLRPEEYLGGAFTISNLGMFGIDEFYPIINPPQLAILGVGAIIDAPIIKEGSIIPGKSLTLCLAADHRAMDGTDAAAFLKTLKEFLERPSQLIL
jgi:pyruvate dehydrogenase E2 component (dihydrolipoamide acetyltransferase)